MNAGARRPLPATPAAQKASTTRKATAAHSIRHIPELDGIRGIAALVVFFHHAFATSVREVMNPGWPAYTQSLARIFEYANTGVDLFFVLSGYLITSILIKDKSSTRYYQDFYWKRGLRILPLYIVTLAVTWYFLRQTEHTLLALAFIVNFGGLLHLHVFEPGPFWSLAIEEQFYLIWPTVVRRLPIRRILQASLAVGLGCILLRLVFAFGNHHDYGLTFLRCDGLAFGATLAWHFHHAGNDIAARRRYDPLLYGIGVVGVVLIAAAPHMGSFSNPLFQTGVVFFTGPVIGLSISHTGSPWLAVFRSRILVFFGLISYAFYLVHVYVILAWKHFRGAQLAAGDMRGYWMQIVFGFVASVALSVISRYVLELPAMGLRKYVLKHPHLNAEHADPPLPLAQM